LIVQHASDYAQPGGFGTRQRVMLCVLLGLAAILAAAVVAALAAAHAGPFAVPARVAAGAAPALPAVAPLDPEALTLAPAALKPLSTTDALAANAAVAIADLPNPAAAPLAVPLADGLSFTRSLDCMTAAIYYEAATEPLDGQRAVAQVILNRVRHPAFPHTVCGVVFQGSERTTGCQFSFTCDGSLARVPSVTGWARARQVASGALAGLVYSPVGWATHYHANYVVPYWASSLVKTATVGAHIFYRWNNGWGLPRAFTARYAGGEPIEGFTDPNAAAAAGPADAVTLPDGTVASLAAVSQRQVLAQDAAAAPPAAGEGASAPTPAGRRWVLRRDEAPASPPASSPPTAAPIADAVRR
jgi:spore germination cell wall hydrolase CwlJ-like protein